MDAQPREAEGTASNRSGGDAEATDGRERWRFTSACSGELYSPGTYSSDLDSNQVQSDDQNLLAHFSQSNRGTSHADRAADLGDRLCMTIAMSHPCDG